MLSAESRRKENGMSVFFGIWNFDGRPVEVEALRSVALTSAEGNDDETIYAVDNVGFICMPSYTQIGPGKEIQPYVTSSNLVFGWDGRLDNREGLLDCCPQLFRRDLSDLAVVAATFEIKKEGSFAKLIGDWVLSVWNPVEKKLYLGKDYLGIRHLYYALTTTRVVWSTHLEPLAIGASLSLDDEYVAGHLANYPSAHRTPYREINAVPPGHFVEIHDGIAAAHRYWSVSDRSRI